MLSNLLALLFLLELVKKSLLFASCFDIMLTCILDKLDTYIQLIFSFARFH